MTCKLTQTEIAAIVDEKLSFHDVHQIRFPIDINMFAIAYHFDNLGRCLVMHQSAIIQATIFW